MAVIRTDGAAIPEWEPEVRTSVLEESPNVSYIVDSDLTICFCNLAWNKFAIENGGAKCTSDRVLGTALTAYMPEELRTFYTNLFSTCIQQKRAFEFDFECSSAQDFRLLRTRLYPFRQWDGVLISNSTRIERAQDKIPATEPIGRYIDSDGFARLCSLCRRARHKDDARWDWVPELLDRPEGVTHGLCPICCDYMYRLETELFREFR